MKKMLINSVYSKEDINENLENVNSWINNCDTKTSIILGVYGVIIATLFAKDKLTDKCISILNNVIHNVNFSDVLYILFNTIAIFLFVFGVYKLIKVLIPTLKNSKTANSHFYFGGIASFSSALEFKQSIKKMSEENILDELLTQLYTNSVICNKKFNNFKYGVFYSLIGLILMIILFIIGIIIY